jgi:hypothetical protein
MSETRGERRAETAKRNDDSGLTEGHERDSVDAPEQQGRAGGNLQRDIGTRAEDEKRVVDPQAHEGVAKEDDIAHGQRREQPRPATQVVTERD